MRLKQNSTNAVVVRRSWANLQGIKLFLRDCPVCEIEAADDSHVIFARALDDSDERGLWIELNTAQHARDAAVELKAMMIPWSAVLAVVCANEFAGSVKEARELGFGVTVT
jgi:hypothetical protein